MTRNEARTIRTHLGHGTGSRRVVVKNDGNVHYTGSTDDYDRTMDGTWFFGGYVEDLRREIDALRDG